MAIIDAAIIGSLLQIFVKLWDFFTGKSSAAAAEKKALKKEIKRHYEEAKKALARGDINKYEHHLYLARKLQEQL